jgi:hypothetical protein
MKAKDFENLAGMADSAIGDRTDLQSVDNKLFGDSEAVLFIR